MQRLALSWWLCHSLSFHQTEVAGIWMDYLKVLFKHPSSSEDGTMFTVFRAQFPHDVVWSDIAHFSYTYGWQSALALLTWGRDPGETRMHLGKNQYDALVDVLYTLGVFDTCHLPKRCCSVTAASSSRIMWPVTWPPNSPDLSLVEYLQDVLDKQVWSMKALIDYRP